MTWKYAKHIWLAALFVSTLAAQSVNVPLDYWGYRFLDRLETKGLFSSHELRARPLPRQVFADLLLAVHRKVDREPGLLSAAEWQLFEQMKSDFRDELIDRVGAKGLGTEPHFLRWQEPGGRFYLDLYGREAVISNRGDRFRPAQLLSETTMGGILRGLLGERLGFYVDARNAVTRGSDVKEESFDVSKGSPVVISGPNVIRDRATAYFVMERPWLRLELGRDEIDWGPSLRGGISVSRNMPPADMVRLTSRFKRFRFTSTHALLESSLGPKYLAAHRLDVMVRRNFFVGAGESVVYGGRDIEPAYLNPLMPYHVAEHHLGDKDNNTLSLDFTFLPLRGTKFYAELFIDDMTLTRSLTSYFGNKFAFLIGGVWADPFRLANVDVRLEYTRIEPYVYSHWDSLNIYTHYDRIIGHWLGPNGDDLFLRAGYQLSRDFRAELSIERIRKGEGAADTRSRPTQGEIKHFLAGVVEHRTLYHLKLINQVRRDLFVSISYTHSQTRNLSLIGGNDAFDHLVRFEVFLNY